MRVLCIQDSTGDGLYEDGTRGTVPDELKVYFGEIYTVLAVLPSLKSPGELSYKLAERPSCKRYQSKWFSPLSEIDEKEMQRDGVEAVRF